MTCDACRGCDTYASQPQTFNNDKLGCFPVHISYGVVSTELDGIRFNVNATVSRVYPQKYDGRSVLLIIDLTMSNSSLAFSLYPTKGAFVIFPIRHDSHVPIDS